MTMCRTLMLLILTIALLTACTGSNLPDYLSKLGDNGELASIRILELGPTTTKRGKIEPYQCDLGGCKTYKVATITAKIVPKNVTSDVTYFIVLSSKDGFIFDFESISWNSEDLLGPRPQQRDVGEINKAEARRSPTMFFQAPLSDKGIDSLVEDYNAIYAQKLYKTEERMLRELTRSPSKAASEAFEPIFPESDVQQIVKRHISIEIVDQEELERLLN